MSSPTVASLIQKCNAQPKSPSAPGWFATAANESLVRQGTPSKTAAAWSTVYGASYTYVIAHPALFNASTAAQIRKAFGMAATPAGPGWIGIYGYGNDVAGVIYSAKTVNVSLGIAGLSGLIDVMDVALNANGIRPNGCATSIGRVSLDLAGMAAGGATALSGVGAVLFVMGAAGAVIDIGGLAKACGPS